MISQADLKDRLAQIEKRCEGTFKPFASDLHGIGHLREVALLAGQIAYEMGADIEAAMVAGFLHDSARKDDGGGNQHALDSATLAGSILKDRFPHLDAERICSATRTRVRFGPGRKPDASMKREEKRRYYASPFTPAALTIATIPAFKASGRVAQADTIAAKSGSVSAPKWQREWQVQSGISPQVIGAEVGCGFAASVPKTDALSN